MEYLENKRKEELLASIKESESTEEIDELEEINKKRLLHTSKNNQLRQKNKIKK